MREYFQDQMDQDIMEPHFQEVEKSDILQAVEAAEATMTPLLVEAEPSEHIAEGFALPAIDIGESKAKGLSIKKAILAALEERREKYTKLKISGVLDKAGAKLVYEARIEMKNIRLHFEKAGKRLTEEAKTHIKNVGLEGKRLISLASVTEDYLEAEEKAYEALVNAEKAAKQKALDERNQGRMDALLAVGAVVELAAVVQMTDEMFNSYLDLATKSHAERERVAAEAAAAEAARIEAEALERQRKAKEEADRLQAERDANAKAKAENDRMAAELKAQMDEINKAKADIEREAKYAQIMREAEAKAKADAEAKAAAEKVKADQDAKDEAARKAKADHDELVRQEVAAAKAAAIEAAKPDAEKLKKLAFSLAEIAFPAMSSDAGRTASDEIQAALFRFVTFINTKADGLTK